MLVRAGSVFRCTSRLGVRKKFGETERPREGGGDRIRERAYLLGVAIGIRVLCMLIFHHGSATFHPSLHSRRAGFQVAACLGLAISRAALRRSVIFVVAVAVFIFFFFEQHRLDRLKVLAPDCAFRPSRARALASLALVGWLLCLGGRILRGRARYRRYVAVLALPRISPSATASDKPA
jgi:hypothetical protein